MHLLKKTRIALPLIIFIFIFILLWRGLTLNPAEVPSPLINHSVPFFKLPILSNTNRFTTNQDLMNQVTLVNVWASWCYACAIEHSLLLKLAQNEHIHFYGWDYKDDKAAALKWLKQEGNPYQIIAFDEKGQAAIDWGIYGTPETFIIDKKGIIRYKQVGPITSEIWMHDLQPLIRRLQSEPV